VPVGVLIAASLITFWGLYTLDHTFAAPRPDAPPQGPFERYTRFDPESLSDAYAGLATLLAAVFGIVITVVSIIVQLSAGRYTGVARMFLRDRVNRTVMGFYVVGCVTAVWLSLALQSDYVPRVMTGVQLGITTVGLVLMAPYFGYVFWFLDPINIVVRIRRLAVQTAVRGMRTDKGPRREEAQLGVLTALEELTDITNNSVSGKDKIIAGNSVDALRDFALEYMERKRSAHEAWFAISGGIRANPDLVAMDPESLADLERHRLWVEWKVLRQYLGIYNDSLLVMRDINYLIAIDTRYIGEAALDADDEELTALVFRFMNSYMRSALNARDVRTSYNVLNQYRLLIETMLRKGKGASALRGVKHLSYYGHLSFDMQLPFVTETVAYDVSGACQVAHEVGAPETRTMLRLLLDLDHPLRTRGEESALLGIRKAQAKLAAYYLDRGEESLARLIAEDMAREPRARLAAVREALEGTTSKEFWEITDRGRSFEYMPDSQRARLATFFAWLEDPAVHVEAVSPPVPA
jgi:hypothetical protein